MASPERSLVYIVGKTSPSQRRESDPTGQGGGNGVDQRNGDEVQFRARFGDGNEMLLPLNDHGYVPQVGFRGRSLSLQQD